LGPDQVSAARLGARLFALEVAGLEIDRFRAVLNIHLARGIGWRRVAKLAATGASAVHGYAVLRGSDRCAGSVRDTSSALRLLRDRRSN